jgi:hypothetical protein
MSDDETYEAMIHQHGEIIGIGRAADALDAVTNALQARLCVKTIERHAGEFGIEVYRTSKDSNVRESCDAARNDPWVIGRVA